MKRISIFASNDGSNLQSIINAIKNKILDAEIGFVLSNNSSSKALEKACKHNIPVIHHSIKKCTTKGEYEQMFLDYLSNYKINLIVLAGYMKLLPLSLVNSYKGKILNIHPSLLPKYGGSGMHGINVHNAVINAKERESGATVHFVTKNYDEGPIILQGKVSISENDSAELVAEKVLAVEHRIYPLAIERVLSGDIKME